jgi:hypothetical protein
VNTSLLSHHLISHFLEPSMVGNPLNAQLDMIGNDQPVPKLIDLPSLETKFYRPFYDSPSSENDITGMLLTENDDEWCWVATVDIQLMF